MAACLTKLYAARTETLRTKLAAGPATAEVAAGAVAPTFTSNARYFRPPASSRPS